MIGGPDAFVITAERAAIFVDARGKLILEIAGDAARPRLTGALVSGREGQYSRTEELMSRCPSTDEPS